ncbi:MAG: D-beta-D-heptose 7-phosphate kinase, partial [uncultured bacterium]
MSNFSKIISKFKNCKILVVGDVVLDKYIWGKVERISPEAPIPVVLVEKETHVPGGASNTANNIVSLGGKANMLGVVGSDLARDIFKEELKKRGISTAGLVTDRNRPTIKKTRVMGYPQHQIVRIDREKTSELDNKIKKLLRKKAKDLVKDVDAIVISDYNKGTLDVSLAQMLVLKAKSKKIPIVVDPKPSNKDWYIGATLITPNKKEAFKMANEDAEKLDDVGEMLLKELGGMILITRGEEGMSLFRKNKKALHIPTKAQEVFDVSGAGDTVVGCLTLALAAGASV